MFRRRRQHKKLHRIARLLYELEATCPKRRPARKVDRVGLGRV